MIETFIEYQKLEKIEVGRFMDRWSGQKIDVVFNQFTRYVENMMSISYDPLDLLNEANNKSFMDDYKLYLQIVNDFDARLAAVAKACFDNSNNLLSLHKVNIHWFNFYVINITNNVIVLLVIKIMKCLKMNSSYWCLVQLCLIAQS